jgi:Rap1a immunity proteins
MTEMTRTIFIVALMLCVITKVASADSEVDGMKLRDWCSAVTSHPKPSDQHFDMGLCLGYLDGVLDFYVISPAIIKMCIPTEVTKGERVEVIKKYLADHPEKLHELAVGLVVNSLSVAYPCP